MALDAAQALLGAVDSSYAKACREEDRTWRHEDRIWREDDVRFRSDTYSKEMYWRDEQRRHRQEDMEQRALENSRYLWTRYVEMNAREVQEKAEQLQGVANISALFAGFGLTALLQFDFDPDHFPRPLMISFAITTALTVGCMVIAMALTSMMHAAVLRIGKTFVSSEEESDFIAKCRLYYIDYKMGDRPPAPRRNFHTHWVQRFEGDWKTAYFFYTAGVPAFIANVMVAGMVKFWKAQMPSYVCILVIMGLCFLIWTWAHRNWAEFLVTREPIAASAGGMRAGGMGTSFLPSGLPFDWHGPPRVAMMRGKQGEGRGGGAASSQYVLEGPSQMHSNPLVRLDLERSSGGSSVVAYSIISDDDSPGRGEDDRREFRPHKIPQ